MDQCKHSDQPISKVGVPFMAILLALLCTSLRYVRGFLEARLTGVGALFAPPSEAEGEPSERGTVRASGNRYRHPARTRCLIVQTVLKRGAADAGASSPCHVAESSPAVSV